MWECDAEATGTFLHLSEDQSAITSLSNSKTASKNSRDSTCLLLFPFRSSNQPRKSLSLLNVEYCPSVCVLGGGAQAVPQQIGSAESDDGCWRQTAVALIGFWIWRDEDGAPAGPIQMF